MAGPALFDHAESPKNGEPLRTPWVYATDTWGYKRSSDLIKDIVDPYNKLAESFNYNNGKRREEKEATQ